MNKYVLTVRVRGQILRTAVYASSTFHAQLICQYLYGINNVIGSATQVAKEDTSVAILDEVAKFIKPIKPLTPQQTRIDGLKRQKDTIAKQLKAERARQKMVKAQQQIFNLSK
jgi:hypothetical protein